MRSPATAKDDQPGPTGRRHNWTGGEDAQLVLILIPVTTLFRPGPRKPGQAAAIFGTAGAVGGGATGRSTVLFTTGTASAALTGTGTAAGGVIGSAPDWATSFSSAVLDHRHAKS